MLKTDILLKGTADMLLEIGAVKFGAFKLKLHEKNPNAPLSPIYIDLRLLRSFPMAIDMVVQVFAKMLRKFNCDCDLIADIPISISPVVAVLSNETRIPMITPRQPKEYGTKATVEGAFRQGERVVVLDDLITGADTKLEAINALEEKGLFVSQVIVLIDREQGGREKLEERGYQLHAAMSLTEMLEYYFEEHRIERTKYDEVLKYLGH